MPFDETTSKPFKNVSIQLILNEEEKKDQAKQQEDSTSDTQTQTPLSSPDKDEVPPSTLQTGSPASYNHLVGGGPVVSNPNPNYLHNYPQNSPYNVQVPYYPIQTSPEYVDNRRGRRFRRRYNQILRKYMCSFPGCSKSYGSLNHLNTHIVSKSMAKESQRRISSLRKIQIRR